MTGALAVACGGSGEGEGTDSPENKKGTPSGEAEGGGDLPALLERPWEVVSKKGETYLSNVFYAEPSENEQVMPWTVDGRTVIDRLVYPTLGNPNLYVKSDVEDELVVVLRIEPDAFAHLSPRLAATTNVNEAAPITLTSSESDGFAFWLVTHAARDVGEGSNAVTPGDGRFAIKPTKIIQSAEPPDMPVHLRQRKTLRFVFDKKAMANVPAGLYDARFEVKKEGEVYASVFEYQSNAVRVFDKEPDEYSALNVTDTQVSAGSVYATLTADILDQFVDNVNGSDSQAVRNAAFITFNGDLHNGGSPGTIRTRPVATTYQDEAKRVLSALKRLTLPIFLTPGNHDGIASLGHVPNAVRTVDNGLGETLEEVFADQNQRAWPDLTWEQYASFLAKTEASRAGYHRDLFAGRFTRSVGDSFAGSFKEVPAGDRNIVLYDGFYQWQKTYGPLTSSWTFGKNRYVSMNSFELRQHRRTGWGMYTVNYGGGISRPQMEWLDREIQRGKNAKEDLVVLMHHDPRGGHKGLDLGYYFPLIEWKSMDQSLVNYLLDEVFTPLVCKQEDWTISVAERDSCLHDGLQEWMGPDEDFDRDGAGFYLSGVEVLKRIVRAPHVRTLLLGHAHFNTLEVMQSGQTLVPDRVTMPGAAAQTQQRRLASLEVANPVRRTAWSSTLASSASRSPSLDLARAELAPLAVASPETHGLGPSSFDAWRTHLDGLLSATPRASRTMSGDAADPHELAIIRLTSNADLASQQYGSASMFGYSILHVTKQTPSPRINRITYFIHADTDAYAEIATVDIDRLKPVPARGTGNPVDELFDW